MEGGVSSGLVVGTQLIVISDKMRVLIFHPALAPYRVDFFNELGKRMNLRVVFMTRNNANQAFNQN